MPGYYRDAHGFLLCFSLNDLDSFGNVRRLLKEIQERLLNTAIVLVGTKSDLPRLVDEDKVESLFDLGLPYVECSAKSDVGVEEAFERLLEEMIDQSGLRKGVFFST